jgi:hypothetical protein
MKLDREIPNAIQPRLEESTPVLRQAREGSAQAVLVEGLALSWDAPAPTGRQTRLEDETAVRPGGPSFERVSDGCDAAGGVTEQLGVEHECRVAQRRRNQTRTPRHGLGEGLVVHATHDLGIWSRKREPLARGPLLRVARRVPGHHTLYGIDPTEGRRLCAEGGVVGHALLQALGLDAGATRKEERPQRSHRRWRRLAEQLVPRVGLLSSEVRDQQRSAAHGCFESASGFAS